MAAGRAGLFTGLGLGAGATVAGATEAGATKACVFCCVACDQQQYQLPAMGLEVSQQQFSGQRNSEQCEISGFVDVSCSVSDIDRYEVRKSVKCRNTRSLNCALYLVKSLVRSHRS